MIGARQTRAGRIVYDRKKHLATVRTVVRFIEDVANRASIDQYRTDIPPWKYIYDIAKDVYSKMSYKQAWDQGIVSELRTRIAGEFNANALYDDSEWYKLVGTLYNYCLQALNIMEQIQRYFFWLPFVGDILGIGVGLCRWLIDYFQLKPYQRPTAVPESSKPAKESVKP